MTEKLVWIIDRGHQIDEEEGYKENRDFVHSLGLKCDVVGWCEMDLAGAHSAELLGQIARYREERDVRLRGHYYAAQELKASGWYILRPRHVPAEYRDDVSKNWIRADRIPKTIHCIADRSQHSLALVSEEFRSACLEEGFTGVSFLWKRDVGKYRSKQYFELCSSSRIPSFYSCNHLSVRKPEQRSRLAKLEGQLPGLLTMFHELSVNAPVKVRTADLPDADFAYYLYDTFSYSETGLLIRQSVAKALLKRRLITREDLIPLSVAGEIPDSYDGFISEELVPPDAEELRTNLKACEEAHLVPRPERKITEKMALELLRRVKRQEKEHFSGPLSKARCVSPGSIHERLVAYYRISDGGELSDEYRLLSLDESLQETRRRMEDLELEELTEPVRGTVIAITTDGDDVIVTDDGTVRRMSHEDLQIIEEWVNVETFVYEAI